MIKSFSSDLYFMKVVDGTCLYLLPDWTIEMSIDLKFARVDLLITLSYNCSVLKFMAEILLSLRA